MITSDCTTELVLDRVQQVVGEHLQDWLTDRLTRDAGRPAADRLYAGVLPMPVHYGRGDSRDFAQTRITPSMYLTVVEQVVEEVDASGTYDVISRMVCVIVLSEGDVEAGDARVMQNALSTYGWGVAWCVREYLHREACDAGVIDAATRRVQYSPDLVTDESVWFRLVEVEMDIRHRVLGAPTL